MDEQIEQALLRLHLGTSNLDYLTPQMYQIYIESPQIVEAKAAIKALFEFDPLKFVDTCEPNCHQLRHAYHQGQENVANKIAEKLQLTREDTKGE